MNIFEITEMICQMSNFSKLHPLQKGRFEIFNLGATYFENLATVKLVPLLDYW